MTTLSYCHILDRHHARNLYPVTDLGFAYHPLKPEEKFKKKTKKKIPYPSPTLYKKAVFHLSRLSYHTYHIVI